MGREQFYHQLQGEGDIEGVTRVSEDTEANGVVGA